MISMVAGEASGDLLAGLLLQGLHARWGHFQATGIGGPHMAAQGFQAWWPNHKLAVHGYNWEVLRRYREILGIRNQLQARLLQERPEVFIGVDAPDFNLDLERNLRQAGIKTVHFVCPSIWAWRANRVEKIRRSADHVLCIFPFEPELLARHGIAATYVGHPLASAIPLEPDKNRARAVLGLNPDDKVLALLPGSRASEIAHIAPPFIEAAKRIRQAMPSVKLVLPTVPTLRRAVENIAAQAGMREHIQITDGASHTALAACDVTLIASGTATLEAALFKRPMVIAYCMGWLSFQIMRRKQLQPWIGLPNILSQEFVVPEFLPDRATPTALAESVLQWFDDMKDRENPSTRVTTLEQRFTDLHHRLQRDTSKLAADAIQTLVAR